MKLNAKLKFFFAVIIIAALTIIFWRPLSTIFTSPETIRNYILSFGIFAPLVFIFLVMLQVLLAPIPGQVAGLAGGYIFGFALGTLYSMIGLIIGSFIVFVLSRKLGRPFVEKVVDKKTLEKFDTLIIRRGLFFLFLIYLLPALPDDAVSYLAGLTKFKIKTLLIISAVGRLPGFIVLSLIGAGIASQNSLFSIILFASMILASFLIFWKKDYLENLMLKLAKRLKTRYKNSKLLLSYNNNK